MKQIAKLVRKGLQAPSRIKKLFREGRRFGDQADFFIPFAILVSGLIFTVLACVYAIVQTDSNHHKRWGNPATGVITYRGQVVNSCFVTDGASTASTVVCEPPNPYREVTVSFRGREFPHQLMTLESSNREAIPVWEDRMGNVHISKFDGDAPNVSSHLFVIAMAIGGFLSVAACIAAWQVITNLHKQWDWKTNIEPDRQRKYGAPPERLATRQ